MTSLLVTTGESGRCHEFTPERGPSVVVCDFDSYLTVQVQNISAKVWRGPGKVFHQQTRQQRIEAARAAYKSASVHAALDWLAENGRGCMLAAVRGE